MLIMIVALVAAGAQMAMLLLTAHLIGVEEYGRFSLIMTVGILASTVSGEWLRMILARHAGMRHTRVRGALLSGVWRGTIAIAGVLVAVASTCAALAYFAAGSDIAWAVLATGVLAAGGGISDMVATYLRFAASRGAFNRLSLGRVFVSGMTTCAVAFVGGNACACGIAFGASSAIVGLLAGHRFWPPTPNRREWAVIRMNWRQGWSMASGALSLSASSTAVRATLGICLSAELTGSLFLALDLGTRGLKLLGMAISTWSTRAIFDAAHSGDSGGAMRAFSGVASVSLALWFSVGLYGAFSALLVPIIVAGASTAYLAAAALNMIAIYFMFTRTFIFDPFLAAVGRAAEIAIGSSIYTVITVVAVAIALYYRDPQLAVSLAPGVAALSSAIYFFRNRKLILEALPPTVFRFVVIKTAICVSLVIIACVPVLHQWSALVLVGALGGIADASWMRRLIKCRSSTMT